LRFDRGLIRARQKARPDTVYRLVYRLLTLIPRPLFTAGVFALSHDRGIFEQLWSEMMFQRVEIWPGSQWVARLLGLIAVTFMLPSWAQLPTRDDVHNWIEQHRAATTLDQDYGAVGHEDLAVLAAHAPPGFIDEFDFPELRMEIVKTNDYPNHPSFADATSQFDGQASLGDDGSLRNYTAGMPFSVPQLEAADASSAGVMAAWNHIHRWQYLGYEVGDITFNFVVGGGNGNGQLRDGFRGGGSIDRFIAASYNRVYLSHLASLGAQNYRVDIDDAERLFWKERIQFLEPFDIKGTAFVIERALAPHEDDQVNSYLPSERRVRRLSAKERADSFMGTNFSLDDVEGFSGRVLDFDWTYLGRKTVLAVVNSRLAAAQLHGPNSRLPDARWEVRPSYVVEIRSHWDAHPVPRKIIFFDENSWNVNLAVSFDREDRLVKSFMNVYRRPTDNGAPENSVSHWATTVALNYVKNDATVTRAKKPVKYHNMKPAQIRRMFSISTLSGGR
jgi:hypothetical protein